MKKKLIIIFCTVGLLSASIANASYCEPDPLNDIAFISSCSYNASTTATIYSYYHIPFLIWLVFWLIISFVFGRLILEFIISMRKK